MRLLSLFCLCLASAAAESLTLREALEVGLRPGHRADTALAAEAQAKADSLVRAGRAAFYPLVEARVETGERSLNLGAQGFGGAGQNVPFQLNPSFTTFDARPTVSVTLFNLAQWKSWKAAQTDTQRAARESDHTAETAAHNITQYYLACLQAQAEVRAAQADVRLSEDLLHAAEQRLQAGTVTAVDLTRAKSQLATDRGHLLAQRQAELEARANLFRAIGLEFNDAIQLAPVAPAAVVPLLTVPEAVAAAETHRADLRQREASLRVASDKVKSVAWEKYPSLSGSFDIGRNGTSVPNTQWTRNATVSLKLTVYDFGRRRERETQAAIAAREEKIRLDDLRREINRQVRIAHGKLHSAQGQIDAARAELELSTAQIDQVRQRLAAGLATGLDLIDAQTRFARSTRSVIKAETSLLSAGVELLNATGQLRDHLEKN